jgi:MYXO-CTERM domain-containing protein
VPLAAGASDAVALVVSVAQTATAGNAVFSAAIAGGGLSGTNQCGRVLFNEYHVENASDHGQTFPNECDTSPMTPQEKFLEFSLYNLSNFVAPVSSDQVLIAGQTNLTWATPAAITYGTPLSGTQLDATANVPGTFVYTPAAGTIPAVGTDTLSVVFTPTNPAYPSATANVMLNVQPATTTTTISDVVSPIYYGQIIGDIAKVVVTAPNTGGNINVFIDGQNVCTLPVITGVTETCPATTGVGYNAGTHTIYAAFTGNTDYGPSTSPTYSVVVLPDPTTAGLASSTNPAIVGQAVKLTATIGDQYATAAGMVNFFDGATQIGAGTLNAQGVAVLTTSALSVGTHTITACLIASLNFDASCSSALQEQVTLVPSAPLATVTLLGTSVNPSVVGQSVTFSASVGSTGAFVTVPAGTVTFRDGAATIGTATLDSSGNASFSTAALAAGLHTITAVYAGNSTTAESTSAAVMQQVNTAVTSAGVGFVMTVTPTTLSNGIGVSAAVSVTITDLNGFDQPVQLACAGLPNETTCTFAQSTIGAEGGTTALIVSPQGPRPCGAVAANGGRSSVPNISWMMAFVVGAFFVRRRRRLLQGLVLMAALCALPMLSGCGDCADLGTKPGNYSFTITGTAMGGSAAVSHTQTMQMMIHP